MIKEWKGTSLMILEGFGTGILGMFFWVLIAPTEWYGEDFFIFSFLIVWAVVMILSIILYRWAGPYVQLHEEELLIFKNGKIKHRLPLDQSIQAFQMQRGRKGSHSRFEINGKKVVFSTFTIARFQEMMTEVSMHQTKKYPGVESRIRHI